MAGYGDDFTDRERAMFRASSSQWPEALEKVLRDGANPLARDDDCQTPLHALGIGRTLREREGGAEGEAQRRRDCAAIVAMLSAAGVGIEELDTGGFTALEQAAKHRRTDAMAALLAAGASLGRALEHAAKMPESFDAVRALVEAGANPLARSVGGLSPLDLARQARGRADERTVAYLEAAEIQAALRGEKEPPEERPGSGRRL